MKLTLPAGSVEDLGAGVVRVTLPGLSLPIAQSDVTGLVAALAAAGVWTVDGSTATLELEDGEITATINVDPSSSSIELNIGPTATPFADRTKLQLVGDGSAFLGSNALSSLAFGADGSTSLGAGGFATYIYGNLNVNLPTADPVVAGALWNDGGTVKVSAG